MGYFDEDDKTVNIPNFVEDKNTDSASVDMSIFKMSDEELYDDVDTKNDSKKAPKKKANSTIILCLIVIAILLVTSVLGIVFGLSKSKEASTLSDEVTQLKAANTDLQTKVNEKDASISALTAQIEELEKGATTTATDGKYTAGTTLYITEDGGGQGVKQKASIDSDFATKNGSDYVLYWGDSVKLTEDATVDASGNYWGKIEGGYIRIEYNGEKWATTEEQ